MNRLSSLCVLALLFTPLSLAQTTRMVDGKLEVRGVVNSVAYQKPFANATVEWIQRRYQPRSVTFSGIDVIGATKSDEKGHFVLNVPVPAEGAHIFVRATADGFAYSSVMYRNGPGEDHRFGLGETIEDANGVTVELERESSIAGVVVDDNDQPIANAEVYDMQTDPVRTDADGHFEMKKRLEIGGRHAFRPFLVRHPDYVEKEVTQTAKDIASGEMRIKLDRGVLISGKVLDAQNGEPVFGAGVKTEDMNPRARGTKKYTYTTTDGSYRLRVPPGKYEISCFYYGDKTDFSQQTFVPTESAQPLDATKAEEILQDLKMDRAATVNGRLTGVAIPEDGSLIAMLRYDVARGEHLSPNDLASPILRDGSFHIFPVPVGEYELILARMSYITREPKKVYSQPLEIASPVVMNDIEMKLKELPPDPDAPASVSGRVIMPNGSPAAGARIMALPNELQDRETRETAKADSDGKFTLRRVSFGRAYTLRAWDGKEQNAAVEPLQVAPGESWSKEIKLKKGAILKGVAKKSTGEPMVGAEVVLSAKYAHGRVTSFINLQTATTNDKGEYELHGFLNSDDGPQLSLGLSPRSAAGDAPGMRAMVTFRGMHEDLKVEPGETLDGLDFEFTEGARATLKAVRREKE
jgi:protocatechuate 3,4-dioxygenase beta subunit